MSPRVEVRPSPIEGFGVFVLQSFAIGETILLLDDLRIVDHAHPLTQFDDPRHCDYLAGSQTVLMAFPERHINHSCDPNTYTKTIDGVRHVLARRQIREREEITYDYSVNSGGDTVWRCHCGAARCRQLVHSDFFHLPLDLQEEYLPLLESWFQDERSVEIANLLERLQRRFI